MSFLGKVLGGGKKTEKTGNKKPQKVGGKKKADQSSTPGEAIQKLRETEDMLLKKQQFLERKIEQELAIAKKNGTQNKRVALQALKRKKNYEKQLEQIDGTLSTIEFQREALENASTNTEILKNMNYAAQSLRAAHQGMDVDKVENLMDDISEQQQIAQQIGEAISQPVGFGHDIDEDELERELEELEQQELDSKLVDVGALDLELPSPPKTEPKGRTKHRAEEDDDDMKELAAWAT